MKRTIRKSKKSVSSPKKRKSDKLRKPKSKKRKNVKNLDGKISEICDDDNYELEIHKNDKNHGNVCRNKSNINDWNCPVGCTIVSGKPYCVNKDTLKQCGYDPEICEEPYILELHGENSHGNVCRNKSNINDWNCPSGCKKTESGLSPYCVKIDTNEICRENYYELYMEYLGSKTEKNFNKLYSNMKEISDSLERINSKNDSGLFIEIVSGDKLKEKIKNDINYFPIVYIIAENFSEKNNYNDMFLGSVYNDFDIDTLWFLLWYNGLIVSLLCFFSNKLKNYIENNYEQNIQSFCTKTNFTNKGFSTILMKYFINFNIKNKGFYLILAIHKHEEYLFNLYRKLGFALHYIDNNNIIYGDNNKIIYMQYKIPINIIEMVNISINNNKVFISPSEVRTEIRKTNHILCDDVDNEKNIIQEKYLTEYNKVLKNADILFENFSLEKKLEYYNVAKQLSELELHDRWSNLPSNKGYKFGYYMTEKEYKYTGNEEKIFVAKRYFITNYLLNNLELNGKKLIDGIEIFSSAFHDIKFYFGEFLKKSIPDHTVLSEEEKEIMKTLRIYFDYNYLPHCYFKVNLLLNNEQIYYDAKPVLYKELKYFIHDKLNGYKRQNFSSIELDESYLTSGISSYYLLAWDYETFLFGFSHEYMHLFKNSESFTKRIFGDRILTDVSKLFDEYDNNYKFEILADIKSFSIMAIILEHSILGNENKKKIIKSALKALCRYPDDGSHPDFKIRVNLLTCVTSLNLLFQY